jgi:hypothetical protein
MTTEEKIQEIFDTADELRVLLKLDEDDTEVEVTRWHSQWHVNVRPALMTFGGKFTHLMRRGHHANTLNDVLDKALDGAKKELELYKEGKTLGVG